MLGINRELFLIACSGSPTLVIMAVPVLHLRHDEYPDVCPQTDGAPCPSMKYESTSGRGCPHHYPHSLVSIPPNQYKEDDGPNQA